MPRRPIHLVTIPRLLPNHLKYPDLIIKRKCPTTFIMTRIPTTDLMVMAHMAVLGDQLYEITKREGTHASNEHPHSRKVKAGFLRISDRQKDVLHLHRAFSLFGWFLNLRHLLVRSGRTGPKSSWMDLIRSIYLAFILYPAFSEEFFSAGFSTSLLLFHCGDRETLCGVSKQSICIWSMS